MNSRDNAMRLIRERVDILDENEYYLVALCIFKDGRSGVLSTNKHTGEASFVTCVTGEPFVHAKPQ